MSSPEERAIRGAPYGVTGGVVFAVAGDGSTMDQKQSSTFIPG
jgi:hypothetical protein